MSEILTRPISIEEQVAIIVNGTDFEESFLKGHQPNLRLGRALSLLITAVRTNPDHGNYPVEIRNIVQIIENKKKGGK